MYNKHSKYRAQIEKMTSEERSGDLMYASGSITLVVGPSDWHGLWTLQLTSFNTPSAPVPRHTSLALLLLKSH